ncbi:Retrovirus-related Pol polyprotein from transposon opus [Stylophora pistillata]|uniref:Retrovirus-related Pol polyprotein from transposon opus n=1 Tax=Stylophora pistillata TaxID=50429 RepID=A0A2B4R4U0_STYPI|nr:Retrovirus-related Pol polyprotein from transposon opus [Stylophora pistillata]
MESILMVKDLLRKGDFLVKIDLKDAYLTVPIGEAHQKFLRFRWKDALLEFSCLPFGLASAPRVFTKLLKPVWSLLKPRRTRLIAYLEDVLVMASSVDLVKRHAKMVLSLLESLGFVVNYTKSVLDPSNQLELLCFQINSETLCLSLPRNKVRKIRSTSQSLLENPNTTVRKLSKYLGLLSSSIQVVFPAPLHYRYLQRGKNASLKAQHTYEAPVYPVYQALQEDLWDWCLSHNILVKAQHIPGFLNTEADRESRVFLDTSDWKLNSALFRQLLQAWGTLELDLFASRLTYQLDQFVSWRPDPQALFTDAFTLDWSKFRAYAFPPFALIGHCLQQVRRQKVPYIVLVAPVWMSQPWYPLLLDLCIDFPLLFPLRKDLLSQGPYIHPLDNLQLAGWLLSTEVSRRQEFLNNLGISSWHPRGRTPLALMP